MLINFLKSGLQTNNRIFLYVKIFFFLQSNEPVQPSFTPTVQLQALTVVTLAKMCLQNEEMAKKVVPAFGRLLSTTSDAALKNNIMYALSDMCVRYASLVDPLLPQMTACLRDPGNFLKIFFLN